MRHEWSRQFGSRLILLVLALGQAAISGSTAGEPRPANSPAASGVRATVEPSPPLSLEFRLIQLQKQSKGGIASIVLNAGASDRIRDLSLQVRLPEQVSFTDGTKSKNLTFSLSPGESREIPLDLLIPRDGKYILKAEATGTVDGKPIRRGIAYKLLVGVEEKDPDLKEGAIEFRGVPGDGGL